MTDNKIKGFLYIILIPLAILKFPAWRPDFYFPYDIYSLESLRIDISTAFLLPYIFDKGLQFGKDIIYAYGPLGFIYFSKYHPATYIWTIAGQIFLSASFVIAMLSLIPKRKDIYQYIFFGAFTAVLIFILQRDAFLQSLIILLFVHYYIADTKNLSTPYIMMLISCSLIALIKISMFFLSSIVILSIALSDILRKKTFPVSLIIFSLSILFFWVASGQDIKNILAYSVSSISQVGGYSEAMSWGAPVGINLIEIMLYIITCLMMIILLFFILKPNKDPFNILPVILLFLFLFTIFKHSFIRHDGHALEAGYMLVFFLYITTVVTDRFSVKGIPRYLLYIYITFSIITSSLIFYHWLGNLPAGEEHLRALKQRLAVTRQAKGMFDLLMNGADDLKDSFIKESDAIKKASEIPQMTESIDLYPDNHAIITALNLNYKPRPTVVSHAAFTPYLARLNAAHLRGPNAPERLIFKIATIDGRYPSFDDGISWPEIWSRYKFIGNTPDYLLFGQMDQHRQFSIIKLGEAEFRLWDTVSIPNTGDLLWAEIEIKKTSTGHLLNFLYKLPNIYMAVMLKNSRMEFYRFIPEIAKTGFVLSPLIENTSDFGSIMTGNADELLKNNAVEAISIFTENWWNKDNKSSLYDNTFKIKLYRLKF